jgi:hypothetical protein
MYALKVIAVLSLIASGILILIAIKNYYNATKSERRQNRKIKDEMRAFDARIRRMKQSRKRNALITKYV